MNHRFFGQRKFIRNQQKIECIINKFIYFIVRKFVYQLFFKQIFFIIQYNKLLHSIIKTQFFLNLQKQMNQNQDKQKGIINQEQSSQQSQSAGQRLKKKLKLIQNKQQNPELNKIIINQDADITSLALQKYENIKKNYNFISFEQASKAKTTTIGQFQKYDIPIHDFNKEMYKFKKNGYCANPNVEVKSYLFNSQKQQLKNQLIKALPQNTDQSLIENQIVQLAESQNAHSVRKQLTKFYKQKRQKSTDILNYQGPWAGYGENLQNGALTSDQQEKLIQAQKRKQIKVQQSRLQQQNFQPYSIFHWKQFNDYKGFSYVDPPADFKPKYSNCFIPKKEIQTWVSSQKAGYQAVRFFPKVGHFLLVGNPQGKVHLFDIMKNRTCAHTYIGHTKAVRDIQFTDDGKHFLSCGFDGQVHYWDTEYGKVLRTFKLKRIPFTMKFHPTKQNSFLVGSNNKKILQFDLDTGTKQFQYSQHLGTINTITFIEQNKFVSSSDDKKLFVWEYGIPVVTKHVSQPEMHTITATAMHPGGQYFAGQSSDNQIAIYQNKGGNFRRIRSKKFASHQSAGYACAIDFSNDGQFLISGDQRGKIFFYDWKTSKNYRTIDGHASVCIGLEWHPSDPNIVASCGWQGLVKLWQ